MHKYSARALEPVVSKSIVLRFTRDSNPEPSDPKSDALSIEPANHCSGVCRSQSRRIYTFISHLLKALRNGNDAHFLLGAQWSSTTIDRWIKYMGCWNKLCFCYHRCASLACHSPRYNSTLLWKTCFGSKEDITNHEAYYIFQSYTILSKAHVWALFYHE